MNIRNIRNLVIALVMALVAIATLLHNAGAQESRYYHFTEVVQESNGVRFVYEYGDVLMVTSPQYTREFNFERRLTEAEERELHFLTGAFFAEYECNLEHPYPLIGHEEIVPCQLWDGQYPDENRLFELPYWWVYDITRQENGEWTIGIEGTTREGADFGMTAKTVNGKWQMGAASYDPADGGTEVDYKSVTELHALMNACLTTDLCPEVEWYFGMTMESRENGVGERANLVAFVEWLQNAARKGQGNRQFLPVIPAGGK